MTSPVDTLKALVVEMRETERELRVEDRSVGIWPDNDTADIVKEWRERTDAAIAALSGGEAEPFAWAPAGMADPRFAEQHFTASRFQIAPGSIPLYTTPRIPDGCVVVPGHYAQNVLYAAAILEQSTSLIDRREGPALRKLGALLTAAPGDEGRGEPVYRGDTPNFDLPVQMNNGPQIVGCVNHGRIGEVNWYTPPDELPDGADLFIAATPPASTQGEG